MPAPEYALWREYYRRFGFETDRIVWAIASIGAALHSAWGGRTRPRDFVPKFWERPLTMEQIRIGFEALPGKTRKISREEFERRRALADGDG